MELLLLKLVALARPLGSVGYAQGVFDLVGIAMFAFVVLAFLSNSALRKSINLGVTDLLIVAIAVWCLCIYLIYLESAYIRDVAKILIPLISYTVVKNIVRTRTQFESLLGWMVAGFAVPVVLSAILIVSGKGVQYVSYWTGVPRYEGAYDGSHVLGHSMALFLMVLTVYWGLKAETRGRRAFLRWSLAVSLLLGMFALYNLYMSQVRSAVLGLITFGTVYLLGSNRRLLIVAAVALGLIGTATAHLWIPYLLPELAVQERGVEVSTMDIGSGRPRMWRDDLQVFSQLPLDRKIAGVGIGNRGAQTAETESFELRGHSDWLEVLTQTGVVGLALFVILQILILRAILKHSGREKYLFLGLFAAVQVMMIVSNSYVWRIQVGHLYWMVLAYVELMRNRPDVDVEASSLISVRERERSSLGQRRSPA